MRPLPRANVEQHNALGWITIKEAAALRGVSYDVMLAAIKDLPRRTARQPCGFGQTQPVQVIERASVEALTLPNKSQPYAQQN